jgi:hypothetical protein
VKLSLYAPDAGTLTALARQFGSLPGVQIHEERRRVSRRGTRPLPHARDERSGRERRGTPPFRGTFTLGES